MMLFAIYSVLQFLPANVLDGLSNNTTFPMENVVRGRWLYVFSAQNLLSAVRLVKFNSFNHSAATIVTSFASQGADPQRDTNDCSCFLHMTPKPGSAGNTGRESGADSRSHGAEISHG